MSRFGRYSLAQERMAWDVEDFGQNSSSEEEQPERVPLSKTGRRVVVWAFTISGLVGITGLLLLVFNTQIVQALRLNGKAAPTESVRSLDTEQAEDSSLRVAPLEARQKYHASMEEQQREQQELEEVFAYHPFTTAPPAPVALSNLAPKEDLFDGNVCEDDEEVFGELCYKKCSLLTDGTHPIRTSPMSCCISHPCLYSNQLFKVAFCGGLAESGDLTGNGCPHAPGACLLDEEMSLGRCYKKCALLTDKAYPYRVAAGTCCKVKGAGCINLFNTKTSDDFNVGGGMGDGDPATPRDAHFPLKDLTEAQPVGV